MPLLRQKLVTDHLNLIDVVVSLRDRHSKLKYAYLVLGEEEYRGEAALALSLAASRYEVCGGSSFGSYALCTMIPRLCDAASMFERYKSTRKADWSRVPTVKAVTFAVRESEASKSGEYIAEPSDREPVEPALTDEEFELLWQACRGLPGLPGYFARECLLGGMHVKELADRTGVKVQAVYQSRPLLAAAVDSVLKYTPAGGLVRRRRRAVVPRDAAIEIARCLESRKWHATSWYSFLSDTTLSVASLNAGLRYDGWFEVEPQQGLYFMPKEKKQVYREVRDAEKAQRPADQ